MAKRKQNKSKKKARRRLKHQEQAARAKLLKRVKRHEMAVGRELLVDPSDQIKMSEVLLDFAAPLLESFESEVPAKKIISLAILAWNLSLVHEEDHSRFIEEMAGDLTLNAEDRKGFNDVLKWLVNRKRKLFAAHNGYIIDYQLSEHGDRLGLQVASLAPEGRRSGPG